MISDDMTSLLLKRTDRPVPAFRQGVVQSWNAQTGENVIQVGGALLVNLPSLTAESASLMPGDVVSVVTTGDKWQVQGKLTTPGDPGTVPTWNTDITSLQTDVVTAQETADTAQATAADAQVAADAALVVAESVATDGNPPASSPTPEVLSGAGVLYVRWPAIVNHDPVRYQVHVSATSGFTEDSSTLAGIVSGTAYTIKALPGSPPANPNDPDPRKLLYDVPYFVRIVAEDDDGAAAAGPEASGQAVQVTGEDIAADTIVGNHILGGTITGDLFASTLAISSAFWTALTGQRAGFTPEGFFAFKSDDSPIFRMPTDGSNAFLDAELVVRGATVTGGMSIQSSQNELTADAALTLMRGVVAPSATPQFVHDYERLLLTTSGLTSSDKTGPLGTFDLVPGEVSQLEFHGTFWVVHQIRNGGTRSWFFTLAGAPLQLTSPNRYFDDHGGWQIYSTTTLSGSAVPSRDGVYTMFKFTDDGRWYLNHPGGISKYSLSNSASTPVIGHAPDDIYIAEVTTTGALSVNFYRPVPIGNGDIGGSGLAPFANRSTPASTYGAGISLTAVLFDPAGFGIAGATDRYAVSQRYTGSLVNVLVKGASNTVLYPGSSSENWASPNRDAESFEAPDDVQRRGFAHDGTNFWMYGSDGYLYKHSNEYWNNNTTSSKVWGQVTLYDSDAGGTGTHESKPGPAISIDYKRRSRLKITMTTTPPDNGGPDDPDKFRFYLGRGNTKPANSGFWRQTYEGLGPTTITTLVTSGSNPPTVEGFPGANPAQIKNDDASLYVKGDGSGRFVDLRVGAAGATPRKVLREDAFWYGYMAAPTSAITSSTNTLITGFTVGDPNETGEETNYNISFSAGVFTVTDAGWYLINVGLLWAAHGTGLREVYVYRGNTGGTAALSATSLPHASVPSYTLLNRKLYLQAGGQFRVICRQESGAPLNLFGDGTAGTAGRHSYINIDRDRS